MIKGPPPQVAVLLATHNGARFLAEQITSLAHNRTPFTLHWLDDQSSDDSREVVRAAARNASLALKEWHQSQRQGPWIGFYTLLEHVEADVYMFCDQDDIWQPGKIDATVSVLLPDLALPVLCFSDPLTFNDARPHSVRSTFAMMGQRASTAIQESRIFMSPCTFGHTEGFTRPLRDLFLKHKEIARTHSMGHDWWIYLLAASTGTAKLLSGVPTTLYRRHGNNFSDLFLKPQGNRIVWMLRLQQLLRRSVSQQARGFLLAGKTLPPSQKLERAVGIARLVAKVDRRQSPAAILRLIRLRALWPSKSWAVQFCIMCLLSNATDSRPHATDRAESPTSAPPLSGT